MRKSIVVAALLALAAGGAAAQTPPAKEGPQNSAINTSDSANRQAAGPVKGANSFTEGEAKSRIEDNGFANVIDLKKDDDGIWRGRAMKGGQSVDVALDYQGNVFTGSAAQSSMTGTGQPMPPRPAERGAGR